MSDEAFNPSTRLLRAGRPHGGWINTPVTRASTYVFDTVADWRETRNAREQQRMLSYGARGTNSTHALEDALVELEAGARAQLFPTGQAAIAVLMLGLLKAGDHVLVTDAVYGPVRRFCTGQLERLGIRVEFFAADGNDLESRVRPETRLIYAEMPGSLAYEIMDLPQASAIAKKAGCLLAVDNTWGSGLLCRPLELGADFSILAATKYLGGHADVMMGAVVATQSAWPKLQAASIEFGQTVGSDDAYLVLRGMRTLGTRLATHERHAMAIASWLKAQPWVSRVLCPALPEHPGHEIWKRDCHGTNGLLSIELPQHLTDKAVETAIDRLVLFGIGASWGGFESLVLPVDRVSSRTVADWSIYGPMVRLHVGLEDPDDLIRDLDQAFSPLAD